MAASLRTKAAERSVKTNTAAYYSYLDDSKNPVLQSFEAQITDFKNFVAKQQKSNQTIDGRLSETLFQLWSSYQPRISVRMYCEKLMHLGEFLVAHEKYNIALFQCYQRFLNEFGSFRMQDFQTIDEIEEKFFPRGVSDATADMAFRALMGCALCLFYLAVEQDPKVQLDDTLDRCLITLSFIRLLMNLALKDDRWSWIVYNGTIYLYKMSRYLMTLGFSSQVVEYLVWAAVTTEMCLPLLTISYLPWRSTLYCAACEAFYDSRISPDGEKAIAGENFAHRALEQFKNLHELQSISVEGDKCQLENSFRYATIKVATMIFKRMVFENRRKAKGVLRPKFRQNYKELSGPWPRTLTEKLLGDMFDCRCAQFLAILQALSDSNRRLVLTGPVANEQEIELLDVTAELFYAAQYILQVKHANVDKIVGANENNVYPNITVKEDINLIDLAVNGQYVIPLSYVLQLLKYAFNYQVYDIFESLMEPISELVDRFNPKQISLLALIQILYEIEQNDRERKAAQHAKNVAVGKGGKDEKKKQRTKSPTKGKDKTTKKTVDDGKVKFKKTKAIKDLIDAAKGTRILPSKDVQIKVDETIKEEDEQRSLEELLEDLCFLLLTDPQIQEKIEPDALADVSLLLWNKCRPILRRFYIEPNDNPRWLTRLDHDHIKWIHLCFQTHEIMSRFNFASIDSCAYAECSLRLGQILFSLIQPSASVQEIIGTNCYKQRFDQICDYLLNNSAKPLLQSYTEELKRQQVALDTLTTKETKSTKQQVHSATTGSTIQNNMITLTRYFPLVFFAEQFLTRSLKILAQSRSNLIRFDGSSMFDRNWSAKSNENDDETDTFSQIRFFATQPFQGEKGHTSKIIDNLIKDLDAELHFVYCRVAAVLEQIPDSKTLKKGPFDQYLNDARGNSHKKALLCAAYASIKQDENIAAEYMQKAYKHLLAAEEEDRLYFCHYQNQKLENTSNTTVPRPRIIARAPDFVFVTAPDFGSLSNKVATYRIFCRSADRPNAKARMADTNYPGSGQQIPASFIKPVKISGLDPDLKYVFSLAVYDANGQLIGESVSESTEPILAAHPISLLFIRSLLSQVSYEIKQYTVAKKVFHSLWTYFVRTPAKIESSIRELSVENPLIIYELRYSRVADSSISLLQKFVNSIFIDLEIFVKENCFYCDMITPVSSNRSKQISRIHACSQLLIALELSCWLNDSSYALQSIIYLYGLLTPLIYYKIFYPSVNQIFEKCISVLEEINQQITKQRSRIIQDNIHHMIACMTYYMSQYLQKTDDAKLSNVINQIGKKFLSSISTIQQSSQTTMRTNETNNTEQLSTADTQKPIALADDIAEQLLPKAHSTTVHNEELKALERFLARERTPHSILTGNEEPTIVYTFINTTPARQSYKEVQKFRKRPVFMEYLSHVLTKSLIDSTNDDFLTWYDDNQTFISKRNELILGPWRMIISKGDGIITISGSNENKYAAALTEFSPERKKKQPHEQPTKAGGKKKQATVTKKMLRSRPTKYHFLIPPNTPEAVRAELEQRQRPAIDKLFNLLPELYRERQARKKFQRFINDEIVWRSQYELLNGICCLDRISSVIKESNEKIQALLEDGRYRFESINPNLFSYDQTNLIIRNVTDDEILDDQTLEQKFEFNFSQTDVKDRTEIINDLLIGQISDPTIYLSQKGDEGSSTRDRKPISPNRQIQSKKTSPTISPRHDLGDLYRQKTDSSLNDPYGFKRIRAYIDRFYMHYRRSIVFAYRSNNWTLLQNVSKSFYDSMEQLLQYLSIPTLNKIFSVNAILSHGYQAMFVGSELLLDMLYRTRPYYDNNNEKLVNTNTYKMNQWFTNVECSWTGTTFNFEQLQDRILFIDLRFVKKFIIRSLHALYVASKWEKLGTIAIKFNALSDHYFADLTGPLLIAAQTALLQQVRDRKNSTSQPHFDAAVATLGRPIHPDDFYTLRPDKLFQITNRNSEGEHSASTLSLGARLDPKGSDFYAQTNSALELISIPLDVEFSRKLVRQALDKTYYSSRSIIECRKLLAFYIYKQEQQLAKDFLIFTPIIENVQEVEKQFATKIEETSTLYHRPLTAGESMDFSPLVKNKIETPPSTQITKESVIEAYETLSKLLIGQNRRDQYCQILIELGDLYFHSDKSMESKTAWCDAIDTLLDGHDVVTTWFKNDTLKNLLSNRTQLLQKCGIWGCLIGAIVTCKLAKYHIHINCDQHLQTCLLSSYFFRSVFFYTLPHSEHDIDYATLFIDNTTHIWPGIQLTSDEFRLNPRALMDTLAYTCETLIRHDICLHILPITVLYDVFALHCRNLQHTVQARLIRLRALIQLDLYHEAHRIIQMLLDEQKLPCAQLPKSYRTSSVDANSPKYKPQYFDNSKSIISDYNIEVLDTLLTVKLSPATSRHYGSHLSIEFHYLLSLFFVRLASRIPVIANLELFQNSELKQTLSITLAEARAKVSVTGTRITSATKSKPTFFQDETTRSFVHIKSYLIGAGKLFAERCLTVLQHTDELSRDYPSNLQSFEYQLLIDCLSLLSECAHQYHLDQLAARYILEILKVLSMVGEDNISEQKVASGSAKRKSSFPRLSAVSRYPRKKLNGLNILFNNRYSQSLNVYTWLKQRAYLCNIMLQQINTLGKVKGTDDHIREEFANVNVYIEHGLNECEQYQCQSMKATFLLYQSLYNLSELVNINENIQRLNTAAELFQSILVVQQNNILSVDILYKKLLTQILLLEHQCVKDLDGTALKLIEEKENEKLQYSILDFFVQMRERIQMTSSNHQRNWFAIPIIPLNNLYSSLLLPFLFAKLRTATIIVDYAYRSSNENPTMNDLFENAQTLFRQCLSLNRTIAEHYVNIDYECLLHLARIGRLQKRTTLTTTTTTTPLKSIVQQLIDAIRLCYLSANDGQFIQTCYFELATILLEYSHSSFGLGRKLSIRSLPTLEVAEQPATPTGTERPSILKQRPSGVRTSMAAANDSTKRQQQQQLKQAASVAIRAATQMAINQKHRVQLPGLAEEFSETNEVQWPSYLAGDIIGYFVLPERRRIYKSEAEREILTLAPHFEPKPLPQSFDAKLDRLNIAARQDLTWLHLLNYQNAVAKRIDNRQLLAFDCDAVGRSNLFFLHVFPRFTGVTQILQSLPHYSSQCIAIYPSDIYSQNVLQITATSTDKLQQRASISSPRTARSAQTNGSAMNLITDDDLTNCPNININMMKRDLTEQQLTGAFSLAWYSTNTIRINTDQMGKQRLSSIFGFYATTKEDLVNIVSIPLEQLLDLHKRYMPIAQVAETDPKQINQNQIHSILQELFILLTREQTKTTSNDNENLSKIIPRLTDPKAYVELEYFLNAKFGAQTNNTNLRDWFANALKQSSNTFLSTQD